ncbi:MAG: type I restriction-modification system subunit M N-terminal domain-containing protein [Verrucomicrobia bacterium]|jgi:type I restriction enzyme M protein|nr:type I restriction-modification system subunit M N-terminal domain-containing protein [Verrucomicrobiota bacterium]
MSRSPKPDPAAKPAKLAKPAKHIDSQGALNSAVWGICDVMRRSNCAGALQYVPEITWILFLRILDVREEFEAERAEAVGETFRPSLKAPYRWRDWAAPDSKRRKELQESKSNAFYDFVNTDLIPHLKKLRHHPNATPRQKVISEIMSGVDRTCSAAEILAAVETRSAEVQAAIERLGRLIASPSSRMSPPA